MPDMSRLVTQRDLMRIVSMGKPLARVIESGAYLIKPMLGISLVKPIVNNIVSPLVNRSIKTMGINLDIDLKREQDMIIPLATMAKLLINHYHTIYNSGKNGRHVAWVNMPTPVELHYAMDVIPCSTEVFAVLESITGMATRTFEGTESYGISRDGCSFDSHLSGAFQVNKLPPGGAFTSFMAPGCDSQGKAFEVGSKITGVPMHCVNTPFRYNDEDGIEYFKEELMGLIGFLENLTGKEMDYEYLDLVIRRSNDAISYYRKLFDLRAAKPVPIDALFGGIIPYLPVCDFLGDIQGSTRLLKGLCVATQKRINKGVGVVDDDALRIHWCQFPPFHDIKLFSDMEKNGAAVVFEEPAMMWWELAKGKDPIDALANKYLACVYNGNTEKRVQKNLEAAKKYKADAAIIFMQWGCRQSSANAAALKDAFNEAGMPALLLDGDCVDARNYASGQVRTRVEAFIEMLK